MSYRIIHIADVHLDMAFGALPPAQGDARRRQLQAAFERALALVRERGADALCIAGDLYEDGKSTPDRGAYLTRVLGALAPARVFISPGNHDPHNRSSLYRQMRLPDNVTVFSHRAFAPVALAPNLTLWGAAHEFELDRAPMINGFACEGAGTHVLLFHGSDRERLPPGKECVAPFVDADIVRANAAHAMVGHFHGMMRGAHYAYPGSLEPHSAAQDGRHTAALVTVENGSVGVEFIDVAHTSYLSEDLDISAFGDRAQLADAVAQRLAARVDRPGQVFCRMRLVGSAAPTLDLDAAQLQRDLQSTYPGTTIEDASATIDPDEAAREGYTVRAEFVKEMRKRIAAAPADQRPQLERALRYGLLAFAGKHLSA
ncbi:MAG: metallophosphoesterase [Candidatus Eremiobacteraeota bacterium]|nr:metallophosphoesterase [Candidatus Eremiobacteraeota bacterium]MBV8366002.1 metallophosphoesterase [Candidatus Eremiobacteraeota bacterium]